MYVRVLKDFVFVAVIVCLFSTFHAEKINYISVEHPAVTYYNPKYLEYATTTAKRYSRDDPVYYYNLSFKALTHIDNDIGIDVYFYEWLTNMYKRGFLEMHFKWCDLVHKDNFFGPALRANPDLRKPCPHRAGVYEIVNCTIPTASIPDGFPFTKGRIYANFTYKGKEPVAAGYVDMELKQMTRKKAKV